MEAIVAARSQAFAGVRQGEAERTGWAPPPPPPFMTSSPGLPAIQDLPSGSSADLADDIQEVKEQLIEVQDKLAQAEEQHKQEILRLTLQQEELLRAFKGVQSQVIHLQSIVDAWHHWWWRDESESASSTRDTAQGSEDGSKRWNWWDE